MVFEKSPRDRVADALAHRPGGIPIDFWAEQSVYESLRQALGVGSREEVLLQFGVDLRYYNGPPIVAQRVPAWQRRPESTHARDDRRLKVLVRVSFEESKHRYGSPRIHEDLIEQEEHVSRKRVIRFMRRQT